MRSVVSGVILARGGVLWLGCPRVLLSSLSGKRFAVAGVSRNPQQATNLIFRKLRDARFEAVLVNPNATEVQGVRCYPDLGSIAGPLDGVVIATHPRSSIDIVRQCGEIGVRRVWLHRSFGLGSVSPDAVHECSARGIRGGKVPG